MEENYSDQMGTAPIAKLLLKLSIPSILAILANNFYNILDPVLIFGWFGIPAMGIAGAAWATVIGQIFGAIVSILLNLFKNRKNSISVTLKPQLKSILGILTVGIATALMQAMTSIAGMLVNIVLIGFSSTAVAVYGICLKLQNMFLVVPIGINLANIGTVAIRILAVSMVLSVYALILGAVLQALGKGFSSMTLTITRQVVFLLPLLMVMKNFQSISLLWIAFPLAEILGIAMGLYLHKRSIHYLKPTIKTDSTTKGTLKNEQKSINFIN